jgi:hypothetical protein
MNEDFGNGTKLIKVRSRNVSYGVIHKKVDHSLSKRVNA